MYFINALDINFKLNNCENLANLLIGCINLISLNISLLNTNKVKRMDNMFRNCIS